MSEGSWGFYEFFAGGGLARLGLGRRWVCLLANEICEKKASVYRMNFGRSPELIVDDVWNLTPDRLPPGATLAWASFPCQDLSLAGNGRGLEGERSGTFIPFWNLMDALVKERRGVPIVVVENVVGAITSNAGRDFRFLLETMIATGYRVGPMVVDAVRFLPQSRPRLFILAVKEGTPMPVSIVSDGPSHLWHPERLCIAHDRLPAAVRRAWVWWKLPAPPPMKAGLTELIEEDPTNVAWHSEAETTRLLSLMSPMNLAKVRKAQAYGRRIAGTVYKRMRVDETGVKVQRAEVRFDQISGCLRTPVGGSSRQIILIVERNSVRSRLLSPREAARLMGVPDSYELPDKYNDAYHAMGDGLAVPAVAWLEKHLLRPLARIVDSDTSRGSSWPSEGECVARPANVLSFA